MWPNTGFIGPQPASRVILEPAIRLCWTDDTGLAIQRGFIAEVSSGQLTFATYVFNLGWTDPTVVLAVGVEF